MVNISDIIIITFSLTFIIVFITLIIQFTNNYNFVNVKQYERYNYNDKDFRSLKYELYVFDCKNFVQLYYNTHKQNDIKFVFFDNHVILYDYTEEKLVDTNIFTNLKIENDFDNYLNKNYPNREYFEMNPNSYFDIFIFNYKLKNLQE